MNPRVIVALDYDRREDAEQFVSLVKPEDCLLKVGLQMFTKLGPDFVKSLTEKGFGVFLTSSSMISPTPLPAQCAQLPPLG